MVGIKTTCKDRWRQVTKEAARVLTKHGRVTPKQNAEFWQAKRLSNVERDRRNLAALEREGWRVLEVWECQTRSPELLEGVFRDFLG